jgi:hypothetical protein
MYMTTKGIEMTFGKTDTVVREYKETLVVTVPEEATDALLDQEELVEPLAPQPIAISPAGDGKEVEQ